MASQRSFLYRTRANKFYFLKTDSVFHQLKFGKSTIGKSFDCDLVLPHSACSAVQAYVIIKNRNVVISNQGINSIRINGEKMLINAERYLKNGDEIRFPGDIIYKFMIMNRQQIRNSYPDTEAESDDESCYETAEEDYDSDSSSVVSEINGGLTRMGIQMSREFENRARSSSDSSSDIPVDTMRLSTTRKWLLELYQGENWREGNHWKSDSMQANDEEENS